MSGFLVLAGEAFSRREPSHGRHMGPFLALDASLDNLEQLFPPPIPVRHSRGVLECRAQVAAEPLELRQQLGLPVRRQRRQRLHDPIAATGPEQVFHDTELREFGVTGVRLRSGRNRLAPPAAARKFLRYIAVCELALVGGPRIGRRGKRLLEPSRARLLLREVFETTDYGKACRRPRDVLQPQSP